MSNKRTSVKSTEQGVRPARPRSQVDRYGMTPEHWARLRAKTEDEIMVAALSDPDAQPLSGKQLARMKRISRAKFIRERLAMSQGEFASTFRIPLGTLRDWEQHRREPDRAARAYLEVIAREPEAVRRALAQVKSEGRPLSQRSRREP